MRKYLIIGFLFLTNNLELLPQTKNDWSVDSTLIENLKIKLTYLIDTPRINCLNQISKKYRQFPRQPNLDSLYKYSQVALIESERLAFQSGTANALLSLAYYHFFRRNDSLANSYFERTMQSGETILDPEDAGRAYITWSYLTFRLRDQTKYPNEKIRFKNTLTNIYKKAIFYCNKAGAACEAEPLTWIGLGYIHSYNFEEAFDYCKRAFELSAANAQRENGYYIFKHASFNMSELYKAAGDYSTALDYLHLCRQIALKHLKGNTSENMDVEIGELYNLLGQYDSALHYFQNFRTSPDRSSWHPRYYPCMSIGLAQTFYYKNMPDSALAILNENQPLCPKPRFLILKGRILSDRKDYATALQLQKEGLRIARKNENIDWVIDATDALATTYHLMNDDRNAFKFLKENNKLKDSVLQRQLFLRLYNYKKESEEQKKASQINLINKDNQLKEQKLKQQGYVKNSLAIGIILLFLLGIFIFRNLLLKRKTEKLTNEKMKSEFSQKIGEIEMQALRAQMNPHFIFNSLSSINKFILKNEPDAASDYLTRFSRLIRMVLINSQKSWITLEDELEMLTLYLDMERLRFKNTFNYHIVFTNRVDAGAVFIPPMLLQPFCENAIWHGLKHLADPQSGRQDQGRLDIELCIDDKVLICTIADNGIGRTKAAAIRSKSAENRKSMGLKITTDRLALLNGDEGPHTFYEIEDLKDENGNAAGTKVILKISYKESIEEMA